MMDFKDDNAYEAARLATAARVLHERLIMAADSPQAAADIAREHRRECQRAGLDFPRMVVIYLPVQKGLQLVRADLDLDAVRVIIFNLFVNYPACTADEMSRAIRAAFPGYWRLLDYDRPTLSDRRALILPRHSDVEH